ncbi:YdcF family protein [Pseudomonadota bacterium]
MLHPEPNQQAKKASKGVRITAIGWDGFAMMVLSALWIVLTFGLAYLWTLVRVVRVARTAQARALKQSPMVVFGMCLGGRDAPSADFVKRLERAAALQPAPVLVLGGFTHPDSPCSEAQAGRAWLIAHGVAEELISTEDRSLNTLENLYAVNAYVAAGNHPKPTLITNRYHLARSSMLAHGLGVAHDICAAEEAFRLTPRILGCMAMEAFFLNWYVVGRWVSQVLGHQGMLERISCPHPGVGDTSAPRATKTER